MKHTPGPWQMHDDDYCPEQIYGNLELIDGKIRGTLICEIQGDMDEPKNLANARLIAAAPDLLAACQAWDEGFIDGESFDAEQFRVWVNEHRRMARAAIAKATA